MIYTSRVLGKVLAPIIGRPTLPVFEFDRANIVDPDGRIRPFDPIKGFTADPLSLQPAKHRRDLVVSAWRLAHAVVRADAVRTQFATRLATLSFFLQIAPLIEWSGGALRLARGVSSAFADFSGTSLAGRVGQGLAFVAMNDLGYAFSSHYPREHNKTGPDFIFEDAAAQRANVEAKGSFVDPGTDTNPKGKLNEAIQQLNDAGAPTPKSFGTSAYLREEGDAHEEPSLLALVDPPASGLWTGASGHSVRRESYACWLELMRLPSLAAALRGKGRRALDRRLSYPILEQMGREFVVAVEGTFTSFPPSTQTKPAEGQSSGPWYRRSHVVGLDLAIFRRLTSMTVGSHGSDDLLDLKLVRADSSDLGEPEDGGFRGSVMLDGSLMGDVAPKVLRSAPKESFLA